MIRKGDRIQLKSVVCFLLWAGLLAPTAAQRSEEAALEAVREEINALEQRLTRQYVERDAGYRALRAAEAEISASASELGVIREGLEAQRARSRTLEQETLAARERLAGERQALVEQVRASYLVGDQEVLKLMLNQEDPARLGRMMVYYDYLNRARSERVRAVGAEIATLADLGRASERAAREFADLESAQTRELETLGRARAERRTLITRIEQSIEQAGNEVQRLREEEERLAQLVAELEELFEEFPVDSDARFGSTSGNLPWPVRGELINSYGDDRGDGQIKWNGFVVAAPAGTLVSAVYHGRVAYADWLPGLGLLVIVDHGEGYMSLYGYNEAILKEPGEWVVPGEVIAQVGDSGGQAQNSLYFEIRRDGQTIDPRPWMRPLSQP